MLAESLVVRWMLSNWKLIAAGLFALAVVSSIFYAGYRVGNSGKQEVIAEYKAYKEAQEQRFKSINEGIAKNAIIANQKIKQQEIEREENDRRNRTKLSQMRQRLERVELDLAFVQLLNDSAARESAPAPGVKDNGSGLQEANPGANRGTDQGQGIQVRQFTLYDLGVNILENNKNHNDCIDQVEWWQDFYLNLYKQFEPTQ